jgi:hypothetical protein
MGNLIGGLLILIVLVALMFGVLAGASNRPAPRRRQSRHSVGGMAPRPTFGHWQAPPPRSMAHPYQDNLKKNQGGWRWQ